MQVFPESSIQTPQCLSGSYSRSLTSPRSALRRFRLCPGPVADADVVPIEFAAPLLLLLLFPLLPGLLTGLEGTPLTDEFPEIPIGSSGDRGDAFANAGCWRFACSAFLLTDEWLIFELLVFELVPPPAAVPAEEGVVGWPFFVSFETLQYGVFTGVLDAGVDGGGKLTVPEECRLSIKL